MVATPKQFRFFCVRALTTIALAQLALSTRCLLDKGFSVGWQVILLISTWSVIPYMIQACRLLTWQTPTYPNTSFGIPCPEAQGRVFTLTCTLISGPTFRTISYKSHVIMQQGLRTWMYSHVLCFLTSNPWHLLSFYTDCHVSKACQSFSQPQLLPTSNAPLEVNFLLPP